VFKSDVGRWFTDPAKLEYSLLDLEFATDVDKFGLAMAISREAALLIMRKSKRP
jgi:hypothetical protein